MKTAATNNKALTTISGGRFNATIATNRPAKLNAIDSMSTRISGAQKPICAKQKVVRQAMSPHRIAVRGGLSARTVLAAIKPPNRPISNVEPIDTDRPAASGSRPVAPEKAAVVMWKIGG